jgi:hypothetical protein
LRPTRRAICSFGAGTHRQLLSLSGQTFIAYGRRFGWDVVLSTETSLSRGRPAAWAKLQLVAELLGHYEDVFWIDADAVLIDLNRDIRAELVMGHDFHLIEHVLPGVPGGVPNTGVFLVHRSMWSRDFIQRLWQQEEFIDHNWWDNAALVKLLGYSMEPPYPLVATTDDNARVARLPLAWNSVPGTFDTPNAAVHHHARADHDDFTRRLAAIASDVAECVDNHPEAFLG